jgi:hypothetical protein
MPEIFDSAMRGYRTAYEIPYSDSEVKRAMGLITLELAARYLIDYFEESYFAYNAKKYASRALQNLTRTRRYLDYARNFLSELT